MKPVLALAAALFLVLVLAPRLRAQADNDVMSQKEIDSLRDAAYIPNDRVAAFERILNTRDQEIRQLLNQPQAPDFNQDMHDYIDQFGSIADEFNDNLDEYASDHRDIRKSLPKLLRDIERWSTTLRAPAGNDAYDIVRRIALESLQDMRTEATGLETGQAAYFKAHPAAAKLEKERANPGHEPVPDQDPH